MRAASLVTGALILLGLGATGGWLARPVTLSTELYAQNRLPSIQAHLDEAPDGFILLAGDSHMEMQPPSQRVCEMELVNGGLSGAKASAYADQFTRLTIRQRPKVAVLTIGTNDIFRKHDPLSAAATARFEQAVERLVTRLSSLSDRVVVTALPPIGRSRAAQFDAEAVGLYSDRIRSLCLRRGCHYADPFADLRDGQTGFALPGALRDGIHLTGYRRVMRALEPALCPNAPPLIRPRRDDAPPELPAHLPSEL